MGAACAGAYLVRADLYVEVVDMDRQQVQPPPPPEGNPSPDEAEPEGDPPPQLADHPPFKVPPGGGAPKKFPVPAKQSDEPPPFKPPPGPGRSYAEKPPMPAKQQPEWTYKGPPAKLINQGPPPKTLRGPRGGNRDQWQGVDRPYENSSASSTQPNKPPPPPPPPPETSPRPAQPLSPIPEIPEVPPDCINARLGISNPSAFKPPGIVKKGPPPQIYEPKGPFSSGSSD